MTAKIDKASADFDKVGESVHDSVLKAETELARLRKHVDYLHSDAYRLRVSLESSIVATLLAVLIVFGVNYFMASAGMSNPENLNKGLYKGLSLVGIIFAYDLWKIWRKSVKNKT